MTNLVETLEFRPYICIFPFLIVDLHGCQENAGITDNGTFAQPSGSFPVRYNQFQAKYALGVNLTKCIFNASILVIPELRNYAKSHVQLYSNSESVDTRLDELKKQVGENPKTLFLIVCDEAHYGATGKSCILQSISMEIIGLSCQFSAETLTNAESPYSKIVNHWNSEDHPNVVMLMMTATPQTLLTTNTKLNRNAMIRFNFTTDKFENAPRGVAESRTTDANFGEPIPRHITGWSAAHEGAFRGGAPMKIVVLPEKILNDVGFQYLTFDEKALLSSRRRSFVTSTKSVRDAKVFWFQGQVQGKVEIYTVVEQQRFYLTIDTGDRSRVYLRDKQPDEGEYEFYHITNCREDLFSLGRYRQEKGAARKLLQFSFHENRLELSQRLQQPMVDELLPEANNYEQFLSFPPDESVKTYCSLNRMVNSIREVEDELQYIQTDGHFSDICRSMPMYEGSEEKKKGGKTSSLQKKKEAKAQDERAMQMAAIYATHILLESEVNAIKWSNLPLPMDPTQSEPRRRRTASAAAPDDGHAIKECLRKLNRRAAILKGKLRKEDTMTRQFFDETLKAYSRILFDSANEERQEEEAGLDWYPKYLLALAVQSCQYPKSYIGKI